MTISVKGGLVFLVVSFCGITFVSSKSVWDQYRDIDAFNEIDADRIPDIPIVEDLDRYQNFAPDLDDDDTGSAEDKSDYNARGDEESESTDDDDISGDDSGDSDDEDDNSRKKREISKRFIPNEKMEDDKDIENEIEDEIEYGEEEDKQPEEESEEKEKFDAKEFEREKQRETEEDEYEEGLDKEEASEEEKHAEEEILDEEKAVEEEKKEIKKDETISGVEKKPESGIIFPDIEEFDDDSHYGNSFKKHFTPVKGFFSNMWYKMKQFPKRVHSYFHGHY